MERRRDTSGSGLADAAVKNELSQKYIIILLYMYLQRYDIVLVFNSITDDEVFDLSPLIYWD